VGSRTFTVPKFSFQEQSVKAPYEQKSTSLSGRKIMGIAKKKRRAALQTAKLRRWKSALLYLEHVDIEEHRQFYARTTKYLLKSKHWDFTLNNGPILAHPNLDGMIRAFNSQCQMRMNRHSHDDVAIERSVIVPLDLGKRQRDFSKHLGRFTHECMLVIKRNFPARSKERERAAKMPEFARRLRNEYSTLTAG